MLSATPVNNSLRDLRNQIALITEGKDNALLESCGIRDISLSLKNAQTHFTTWADHKKNPQRNLKDLLERLDSTFFKLLDELTIARSRKHIKSDAHVKIDNQHHLWERLPAAMSRMLCIFRGGKPLLQLT